jgi:hypothetical protein
MSRLVGGSSIGRGKTSLSICSLVFFFYFRCVRAFAMDCGSQTEKLSFCGQEVGRQ